VVCAPAELEVDVVASVMMDSDTEVTRLDELECDLVECFVLDVGENVTGGGDMEKVDAGGAAVSDAEVVSARTGAAARRPQTMAWAMRLAYMMGR